jgi:hypothetical protein
LGTNENNNSNESTKLAKIDITNATNLFIAPASNSRAADRAASGESTKLFKITNEGYIQEVSYVDENGNGLTYFQSPSNIYNATDDYVIICFSDEGYLTRKSDGAAFILPSTSVPSHYSQTGSNFKNIKKIQTDSIGNIYYQEDDSSGSSMVIRLDTTDPNNIIKTDYLPSLDTTDSFVVSPEGHIIYDTYTGGQGITRIKKSNGGLYNLPKPQIGFYIGLDGKIKLMDVQTVTSVTIDSAFNVITTTTFYDGTPFNDNYGDAPFSIEGKFLLYFENKIFILGERRAYEIEGDNPREIKLPITISDAAQSDSYYYVSGYDTANQPALLKVDPITDVYQYIFQPNLYDVYQFNISNNDVVTFTALRMADGAKVVGTVSATGNITVLFTTLDAESVILERIR